ncbi:MAG: xanthine dehydrogenase family protein molybdopterin-binding subunit [Myxococcota bacterium]|nr:xanthine dehydrogenase family protein molybdopterin-binding subunit [Myxococcota bacterium]
MSEKSTEGRPLKWVGTRPVRPDGVEKVTGRARYGADFARPDMLWGHVLRSPHAHARIRRIDVRRALELDGVKAIVTGDDLPEIASEQAFVGEEPTDYRMLSQNVLARGKVGYVGHAVAAVAATTSAVAEEALRLIEVDYEILPHVLDVLSATADDAPLVHDDLCDRKGVKKNPSNIANEIEMGHGDPEAAFTNADVVVDRSFTTQAVHQGYIEPHACLAEAGPDGQVTIWCSSQGQFMVRGYTAKLLGLDLAQVRVVPAEIGGGFGGKTTVYLEPLAVALSQRSGRPVKMVMSREEVFRATGPASATRIRVKIGATKEGQFLAGEAWLDYEAGAFPGSSVAAGSMTIFAPYAFEHARSHGRDILVNKPKSAAYRAPGAPMAAFAVESVVDDLARQLEIDPIDLRLQNAAREGVQSSFGPRYKRIGFVETLQAAQEHPHYDAPLQPNQGRGVAAGMWFNAGLQSSAAVMVNADGSVSVISGNPDIGGSRASLAMMAAEEFGIEYEKVGVRIGDTASVGYNDVTGGSRVTLATGKMVVEASQEVISQLCERAAKVWDVDVKRVHWADGKAKVLDDEAIEPLGLAEIATGAARTGGPIQAIASGSVRGVGMSFGVHLCDVEVDPETGKVDVIRYTAFQDAGRAIHPSYVEGQIQGGAAQGIGWALNEEYVFDDSGRLENSGFLDYRMPVASDLPMIDAVIIEVPNPDHPYGVRGVGEAPIVPPIPAVVNALRAATGVCFSDLPVSPPRVLEALDAVS